MEFLPPYQIQPTSDSPHRRNRLVDSGSAEQPSPPHRVPPEERQNALHGGRSNGTSAAMLHPVLMSNADSKFIEIQES